MNFLQFLLSLQLVCASPLIAASFILPTHPFDVVKTRQQASTSDALQGKSLFRALAHIVRKEGVKSLTRGSLASVIQGIPAAFIITGMPMVYKDMSQDKSEIKPLGYLTKQFIDRMKQDLGRNI